MSGRADDRTDEELVQRSGLGDQQAFAELVDRHGTALYRYARRMLASDADAQDAVQDALTAAWLSADRFRGESGARTWLFGVQANCVRRVVRQRTRRPSTPVGGDAPDEVLGVLPAAPGDDPVEHLVATDLREAFDVALRELPELQRAAWLLVQVEQLSYADAAAVLGTTGSAVRGLLERGRQTLGRRLAAWR